MLTCIYFIAVWQVVYRYKHNLLIVVQRRVMATIEGKQSRAQLAN